MSLLMDKLKENGIVKENEDGKIINNTMQTTSRKELQNNILPTARKTFLKNPSKARKQEVNYKDFVSNALPTVADLVMRKKYSNDTMNFIENTGLGGYNGILHFGKQSNDLVSRTHEREMELFNKTNEKFGLPNPTSNLQQKIINNLSNSNENLNNIINRNNEIIGTNINNSSNAVTRKIAEVAPSIGQMLPGFIPGAGSAYFAGSATGQYTEEGLQRGMDKEQARTYGGIMGLLESGTETLGTWLTKGVGKALMKGNVSEALKTYGLDILENTVEETIMEPISETAAIIVGGKDTADFSNMVSRMFQAGLDGGLVSVIIGGSSLGIGSAANVANKINNYQPISKDEIKTAIEDIKASNKIDINKVIAENVQKVAKENMDNFTIQSKVQQNEQLPVINEKNRVNKEKIIQSTIKNMKKENSTDIAPSELMRGINKITKNNLELDVDTLPTVRAKIEGNKITIDNETGRLEDIIHETTHYSENNSKGYEVLSNHVLTELEKSGELNGIKDELRQRYEEQYAKENREFTEQDLDTEVVAKYTERFINDEIFVNKMANTDKTLTQRIYNWIKDKVNYYKKIVKMEPEQVQEYDNLRKAEKLWEKALKGVEENNNIVKYHVSKNFSTEIDKTLNNKLSSNTQVKARDYTPEILVKNGIKDLPMLITQKHIKSVIYTLQEAQNLSLPTKNINYHGLGKELLIKAIDNLDTPKAIYKTNNENFLVVTELKDKNGKKIVVPIQINGKGRYNDVFIDENQIKSVYGRNNLNKYLRDNNFEEIYKKEDVDFNEGIQYSNVATSSNIINSISQNNNIVNNKSMQNFQKNALATAKNNQAPRYSIAGTKGMENAIKYDSNNIELERMYNRAKALQMNGVDNETIRKQTNWFQDKKGDWKFEFTDKQMSLKNNIKLKANTDYKLGDILQHNTLFMVYPQLKDYNVSISEIGSKNGSFSNKYKTIRLSNELLNDSKSIEGTLIHEIQHAIQHIEGFETGTSSKKNKLEYLNSLGEIEATDTKNRFYAEKYEHKNINNIAPESSKTNPQHAKLESYLKNRGIIDKIKDSVYNYFNKRGGKNYDENFEEDWSKNEEDLPKDRYGNQSLVDGRRRINNRELDNSSSFSMGNKGRELTREQQEFFKDSKVRDEKGRLIEGFLNQKEKIYVAYNSNQIKNVDNISPTSNTDIRYSLKDEKSNNPERKFYESVEKSHVISKEIKKILEPKNYRKLTNDESMATAIVKLNSNPEEESKWRTRDVNKTNSVDVAEGLALLAKYQHEKKYESALEVIDRLAEIGTKGGQQVQMFALLQRLTPEGMLHYAQKSLNKALEEEAKYKNQQWIDEHQEEYKLTKEDAEFITERMEKVAGMKDGRDKQILLAEIQKRVSDKLPPDRGASIKAYMRISMLFNPKTQIRNIMGNALIAPVNAVADTFATAVDKAVAKKTGVRTKGLTNVKAVAEGTITGIYKSIDDFKRGIDTRNVESDRFEIGSGVRGANFSNKTRLGRAMNSLDRTLSFMLDMGDRPFYESAFLNSINNQMKLNKVSTPTPEMIEIATTEALQRTWQDNNAYTTAVLKIRDILNGKVTNKSKGFRYGLGDLLIPFAKTPANLTKAIVDYSPPGLVKTLIKNAKELNNAISRNDKDIASYQHKFVDNLGKGMVGSFLYIIGYALAQSGIITGDNDEDKDVANFMRNTLGVQPYSIKIGDKSFTYDWAQPIAAPLGIMANIANNDNKDASIIDKAWDSFTTATSMLVSQSFMQSINELFSSYGDWQENLLNVALELPARAVPTFLKQIADMVDSTQRTSFDKSDKLATAKNKVIAKLPIASKILAPTVDTLGREVKKYGGDNNIFNVFFNPANTNKGQYTESAEEIYNLYKQTGDKTIFPIQVPYSVTINEETTALDAKTRANYQKTTGQYSDNSIKSLLTSRDYKNLRDEEKVKILKNVIEDSNLTAKKEVLNYATDNETQKEKSKETGISLPNMYIYNKIIKDMESKKDSSGKTIKGSRQASMAEYIIAMKTTEAQKNKLLEQMTESENKVTVSDLETVGMENYTQFLSISNANSKDKYKRLIATGINTQELNKYWNNINDIEGEKDKNGNTISGSKKKAVQQYINGLNISVGEKLLLYASSGNYTLTYTEKTNLFNYIKSIKGMTSKEKQELVDSLKCFQ